MPESGPSVFPVSKTEKYCHNYFAQQYLTNCKRQVDTY